MSAGMTSKFGASEMRLNMLDTCVPLEYPVNVFSDVLDTRTSQEYDTLARFCETGAWEEVLRFIGKHLILRLKTWYNHEGSQKAKNIQPLNKVEIE